MLSMTRLQGFLAGLRDALPGLAAVAGALAAAGLEPLTAASARRCGGELVLLLGCAGAGWRCSSVPGCSGIARWPRLAGAARGRRLCSTCTATPTCLTTSRGTLMRGFDTEANLAWHRRAGFDALFLTDHNTTAGLIAHRGPPALCPGIEVSAWKAHIVLLGDSLPVDQRRYNGSLGRAARPAARQRSALWRAQRAVAARVRAQPRGPARLAHRGGGGRARDRQRLAQGQRVARARGATP